MHTEEVRDVRVKKNVWRFRESLLTYIVMLVLSGMHFGLIVPKPEVYELCGQLCECVVTFEMQIFEG